MNHEISILHRPHQVAQKLSKTTFPLSSESLTRDPFASVKLKSGAALRFEEDNFPARVADDEHPAKTPLASAAVRNLLRELVAFHIRGALTVWFEANLICFHSFARCLRLRPKDLENCA